MEPADHNDHEDDAFVDAEFGDEIELEIEEKVAQGHYSNLVVSNFNDDEFIMDFAFIQPNVPKGKVRSRVIMTPRNVKRLKRLLEENIKHYEGKNGDIDSNDSGPVGGFNISFN